MRWITSITIALCASFAVHTLVLRWMAERYVRENSSVRLERGLFQAQQPHLEDFGESTGTGIALGSSEGDQPMQARHGPDAQAFLSLDPQGPGKVGQPPSQSISLPGQGGAAGDATPLFGPPPEAAPAQPRAKQAMEKLIAIKSGAPEPRESTEPKQETPETPNNTAVASADTVTPPTPQAQPKPSGAPGAPATPADPAPQSDSEIDPFSPTGSVDFAPGKVDVRFGRKVKSTRPILGFAAQADLATLPSPHVVFKVKTDVTGNVIDASILQSSGSNEVDLPCQRAIYNWWFEPPKGRDGKPRADVFVFSIGFY